MESTIKEICNGTPNVSFLFEKSSGIGEMRKRGEEGL